MRFAMKIISSVVGMRQRVRYLLLMQGGRIASFRFKRGRSSVIVKKYLTIVKITKQQFLTITKYFKLIN
jgi:hypothetical protein